MRVASLLILISLGLSACSKPDPYESADQSNKVPDKGINNGIDNGVVNGLSERKIAGDYSLQRWEDFTTYYLEDSARDYTSFPDPGPVGGTVVQIGWNEDFIVLQRRAHFYGKVDGWMVIDIDNKSITGPLSDADIQADPQLQDIEVLPAAQAWELL